MTCIVGIVENGKVYLGGDSAGVSGWSVTIRKDPKVFRVGEFIYGFTTSFRMGQLIRYKFTPPTHDAGIETFEYIATKWIDALRDCLKQGGFASMKDSVESGGQFLIGYRGRLFEIDSDYQVGEGIDLIGAVGSGESIAYGALYALRTIKLEPLEKLRIALESAEHFNIGVRAPFVFESI